MKKYLWPLLLLASAVLVAAAVLAVLGRGPRTGPIALPPLIDGEGRPKSLDDLTGRLWLAGLVGPRCPGNCEEPLRRLAELRRRLPGGVAMVVLRGGPSPTPAGFEPQEIVHGRWDDVRALFSERLAFPSSGLAALEAGRAQLLIAIVGRSGGAYGHHVIGPTDPAPTWTKIQGEVEFRAGLAWRPLLHASLNAVSAILLTTGFLFIRRKRVAAHLTCMVLTTLTSLVFLASYLYYHHHAGSIPFRGEGWIRPVYFTLLLSHTLLAAVVPPLAGTLLVLAALRRFDRHKRIARWTLPVWLYVSTTGVLIYLMLYVWYGPS